MFRAVLLATTAFTAATRGGVIPHHEGQHNLTTLPTDEVVNRHVQLAMEFSNLESSKQQEFLAQQLNLTPEQANQLLNTTNIDDIAQHLGEDHGNSAWKTVYEAASYLMTGLLSLANLGTSRNDAENELARGLTEKIQEIVQTTSPDVVHTAMAEKAASLSPDPSPPGTTHFPSPYPSLSSDPLSHTPSTSRVPATKTAAASPNPNQSGDISSSNPAQTSPVNGRSVSADPTSRPSSTSAASRQRDPSVSPDPNPADPASENTNQSNVPAGKIAGGVVGAMLTALGVYKRKEIYQTACFYKDLNSQQRSAINTALREIIQLTKDITTAHLTNPSSPHNQSTEARKQFKATMKSVRQVANEAAYDHLQTYQARIDTLSSTMNNLRAQLTTVRPQQVQLASHVTPPAVATAPSLPSSPPSSLSSNSISKAQVLALSPIAAPASVSSHSSSPRLSQSDPDDNHSASRHTENESKPDSDTSSARPE